jgi:hypothetical protein
MPFNKNKLTNGIFAALGADLPKDNDKAKAIVMKISKLFANAIAAEPTTQVLANEENHKILQAEVDELKIKTANQQEMLDALDKSVGDLSVVVDSLKALNPF